MIDLIFRALKLSPLQVWEVAKKWPSLQDQELIMIEGKDMSVENSINTYAVVSRWSIKNLIENKKLLQRVQEDSKMFSLNHLFFNFCFTSGNSIKNLSGLKKRWLSFQSSMPRLRKLRLIPNNSRI